MPRLGIPCHAVEIHLDAVVIDEHDVEVVLTFVVVGGVLVAGDVDADLFRSSSESSQVGKSNYSLMQ